MTTVVITGCAGFIGSTVLRQWLADTDWRLVGVDKFAYAGLRESIAPLLTHPRFSLQVADICDGPALHALLAREQPDALVHLAAESHVDRSLSGPAAFIQTNLVGTAMLLEVARAYIETLPAERREAFRFLQVSTDEVFGALGPTGRFDETSPHAPNSPYSATKAGADHLVRAWHRSYGLPVLTTHSPNNYGPRQLPEKLIPRMIQLALRGKPLSIYGKGDNVRDWLHVDDHARALRCVLERGSPGETYCIGDGTELSNLDLVQQLCALLDARRPASTAHAQLIEHVADRPGHDWRYAINGAKLERELGWRARQAFTQGLADTVDWYLDNPGWMAKAWAQIQPEGKSRIGPYIPDRHHP